MTPEQHLDFSTVLASSVHDMKNSLSMLLNTIEDIAQQCDPGTFEAEKLTLLQYEGQRVNNHLIQMLSIYKIENSQCTVNMSEHCVADFLEESALLHEPLLTPKGILIETSCDPDLMGFFDREMVAGVINNIVNNAYRYSKDRIRLSSSIVDGYMVISVEDNGEGYPESMLCEDRDIFTIGENQLGSTGLGLYFSSLVANQHKNKDKSGFIRCTNEGIDGGGRFDFYFP